jgi:hypothetical protein
VRKLELSLTNTATIDKDVIVSLLHFSGHAIYGAVRDVLGPEARNASEDAFLACCTIGQTVSSRRTALQLKTNRSRGARSSAFRLGDRLKREQSSAIPDTGTPGRESYRLERLSSGQ